MGQKAEAHFSTADASDQVHAQLLADAPLPGQEEAAEKGLFSGLKRLFKR
jgi:hypothetical protein